VILQALGKTAIKWLLIAVAFIALLSAVNFGLSFVPFTPQFNAKRAVAKAERLEGQVSTLEREAAGNAEIAIASQTFHTREVVIRDLARQAEIEARTASDANTPLDPDRVARIRAADNRLCSAYPAICPDPDAAASGADTVPVADAAR
jgi:hypothetical protein